MSKVFGIGLSRTGTSSLNEALELLGYRSIHFPIIMENTSPQAKLKYRLNKWGKELGKKQAFFTEFTSGTNNNLAFKKPDESKFDAMTDLSVARFYKELDTAFSGSKFIFTIRDQDDWAQSCARFFAKGNHQFFKWQQVNIDMYGSNSFNEDLFRHAYQHHVRDVKTHFSQRPQDLLIINISAGEGWEKLCPFLGKSLLDFPFPKTNVASS